MALGSVIGLLAGCASNLEPPPAPPAANPPTSFIPADRPARSVSRSLFATRGQNPQRPFAGGRYLGTGELVDPGAAGRVALPSRSGASSNAEGVTLNLLDVPIATAVKVVLGDLLGRSYLIDPRIQGQVTLQTAKPVPEDALPDLLSTMLRANGAALIDEKDGIARIVPLDEAAAATGLAPTGALGQKLRVVPLKFVSASEIERLLKPIARPGSLLMVDDRRNIVTLAGDSKEIATLVEAIAVFDTDWMAGMSFALHPLQTSDPEDIADELATIFESGDESAGKGLIRFVPNRRLKAVLVISARPQLLIRADTWIRRLDAAAAAGEQQLFVYRLQNRRAGELATLVQAVFDAPDREGRDVAAAVIAPREGTGVVAIEGETDGQPALQVQPPRRRSAAAGDRPTVRVVADEGNNSLLIHATPADYRRILKLLETMDILPTQVLLEATIAEVSLNDRLKFGLRWFFENGDESVTFTDLATGAVTSTFPGFSYLFASDKARIALDALNAVTDVNVVSSPSLMVLDNRTAKLQVGDQVPVATRSAVSVSDPDAPIVNAVEFRDTGVILSVTPRVNDSGRVLLEIEQEVSEVTRTTSSQIDSPTIQQRKVKTTVAVTSGESVALGGLIQDRSELGRTQVPVLGDIPILGNLVKSKDDQRKRTELLILITPSVVRDVEEARRVTDEFRRRLNVVIPKVREGDDTVDQKLRRVLR